MFSAWSEDGCHIDQTNRTHTICMCNHLTNFAILMDVVDDTAQFIQQIGVFDENMRLLISISIAICIIFIIIALLTLKLFNGIFVKVRNQRNTQPLQTISNIRDDINNCHINSNNNVNVVNQSSIVQSPSGILNSQHALMSNQDCVSSFSSINDRIQQPHQQQSQQSQQSQHHQQHQQSLPPTPSTPINALNVFINYTGADNCVSGHNSSVRNSFNNSNSSNKNIFNTRSHNHNTNRNLNSNPNSFMQFGSNLHRNLNSGSSNLLNNVTYVREPDTNTDGLSVVRMSGINNLNANHPTNNIQGHHHHLHHQHHIT